MKVVSAMMWWPGHNGPSQSSIYQYCYSFKPIKGRILLYFQDSIITTIVSVTGTHQNFCCPLPEKSQQIYHSSGPWVFYTQLSTYS